MVDSTVFEMWLGPRVGSNDRFDPSQVWPVCTVSECIVFSLAVHRILGREL